MCRSSEILCTSVAEERRWYIMLGGGGTPYNGLYGEDPPKRGTFFRLQVYERVGISRPEVYERVMKSVILISKKAFY